MTALTTGLPAPQFELNDLEGNTVALHDFLGRIVLLNFWSAECPWARRVDQAIAALQIPDLVWLSIASNANEPPDLLRREAQARGLPTVLIDPDHQVADLYGAQTTPHCYLIDYEGVLVYQGGYDDVSFRSQTPTRLYLQEAIREVQVRVPVSLPETPPFGCTIVRFSPE
jgi:peroxiredoxin